MKLCHACLTCIAARQIQSMLQAGSSQLSSHLGDICSCKAAQLLAQAVQTRCGTAGLPQQPAHGLRGCAGVGECQQQAPCCCPQARVLASLHAQSPVSVTAGATAYWSCQPVFGCSTSLLQHRRMLQGHRWPLQECLTCQAQHACGRTKACRRRSRGAYHQAQQGAAELIVCASLLWRICRPALSTGAGSLLETVQQQPRRSCSPAQAFSLSPTVFPF